MRVGKSVASATTGSPHASSLCELRAARFLSPRWLRVETCLKAVRKRPPQISFVQRVFVHKSRSATYRDSLQLLVRQPRLLRSSPGVSRWTSFGALRIKKQKSRLLIFVQTEGSICVAFLSWLGGDRDEHYPPRETRARAFTNPDKPPDSMDLSRRVRCPTARSRVLVGPRCGCRFG